MLSKESIFSKNIDFAIISVYVYIFIHWLYFLIYMFIILYFIYTSGCTIFMYLSPNMLCWASQVAQWQRICLPMQETGVPSLGHEDPMEEEMATHSSILAWKNPMYRGTWRAIVHGVVKSQTRLNTNTLCLQIVG